MNTIVDTPKAAQTSAVTWKYIPNVPQIAAVARVGGMPVAIAERLHTGLICAKLVMGKDVGEFRTMREAQTAVEKQLADGD